MYEKGKKKKERKKPKLMASLGQLKVTTAMSFGWTISVANSLAMAKNDGRESEGFERENGSKPTKRWDPTKPSTFSP